MGTHYVLLEGKKSMPKSFAKQFRNFLSEGGEIVEKGSYSGLGTARRVPGPIFEHGDSGLCGEGWNFQERTQPQGRETHSAGIGRQRPLPRQEEAMKIAGIDVSMLSSDSSICIMPEM